MPLSFSSSGPQAVTGIIGDQTPKTWYDYSAGMRQAQMQQLQAAGAFRGHPAWAGADFLGTASPQAGPMWNQYRDYLRQQFTPQGGVYQHHPDWSDPYSTQYAASLGLNPESWAMQTARFGGGGPGTVAGDIVERYRQQHPTAQQPGATPATTTPATNLYQSQLGQQGTNYAGALSGYMQSPAVATALLSLGRQNNYAQQNQGVMGYGQGFGGVGQ